MIPKKNPYFYPFAFRTSSPRSTSEHAATTLDRSVTEKPISNSIPESVVTKPPASRTINVPAAISTTRIRS